MCSDNSRKTHGKCLSFIHFFIHLFFHIFSLILTHFIFFFLFHSLFIYFTAVQSIVPTEEFLFYIIRSQFNIWRKFTTQGIIFFFAYLILSLLFTFLPGAFFITFFYLSWSISVSSFIFRVYLFFIKILRILISA